MWGDATWQEAAALPGSAQLGRSAELLRGLGWSDLVPAPAALSVHASRDRPILPYAARIGTELIAYFPAVSLLPADRGIGQALRDVSFLGLAPGRWMVSYWNPRHADNAAGLTPAAEQIVVGDDGVLTLRHATRRSALPSMEDWVVRVSPT